MAAKDDLRLDGLRAVVRQSGVPGGGDKWNGFHTTRGVRGRALGAGQLVKLAERSDLTMEQRRLDGAVSLQRRSWARIEEMARQMRLTPLEVMAALAAAYLAAEREELGDER